MLALAPIVVILAANLLLLGFLLPSNHDALAESYEPTKTLRFFYTLGRQQHKWGPMPAFVFAPAYAVLLLCAKLSGGLGQLSRQYPFGFRNPVQVLTQMIFAARLITLAIALGGVFYLTRVLQRALGSVLGPPLAVLLSLTTSMVFLEPLIDSKPDGLMVGFLLFALANYASIVLLGATRSRAYALSFFWVASLSCKELTGGTMLLPFLGLLVAALVSGRVEPARGKRNLRLFAEGCAGAVLLYLLLNVVYSPAGWLERMRYVFGPLKDPSIWGDGSQTLASYLLASLTAASGSLGYGGLMLALVALAGTIRYPSRVLALLWLPFVSHFVFTVAAAGYMPAYFMLPLGPALCLPASYVLSRGIAECRMEARPLALLSATLAAVCTWMAFCATATFRFSHPESMIHAALEDRIPRGATVNLAKLFPGRSEVPEQRPGGTVVDERPLFLIVDSREEERPDFILAPADLQTWAQEIRDRPARAAMILNQTGFDYTRFRGFEALGYQLDSTVSPQFPGWCYPAVVAGGHAQAASRLLIYRRRSLKAHETGLNRSQ